MPRTSRRVRLWLIALVVLIAAGVVLYVLRGPWTPTLADADRVAAVEVWLAPWGEERTPPVLLARAEDPAAIRRLLASMEPGEPAPPHKCGDRGWFVFVRRDGNRARVPWLPGHNPDFYEVRPPGAWNRVPRSEFLAAVKEIGVKEFPVDCMKPGEPLH